MSLQDPRSNLDRAVEQWRLLQRKLAPGETVRLTVRSGSMLPLLPVGAEIAVAAARGMDCRPGDIVIFRRGDRLVAHRLLFAWGRGARRWFLERGDGVSTAGIIRAGDVLGLVVEVIDPEGRRRCLEEPAETAAALGRARRNLVRLALCKAAAPMRKVARWFRRGSTGCA